MVPLTELLDRIRGYHDAADTDLISRAYLYAARMHQGQRRRSGDPYFTHPVSVAEVITGLRLDTASVCAALLHDVLEDTAATQEDLVRQFGDEVAFLVEGVTKLGKLDFASKEDRQAESLRKMLLAMARDIRVLLVKLADRLDNMRTLHYMAVDQQERIGFETVEIYAPLAGRLGIQWLKDELEDLSFKYTYPEQYAHVARKLAKASPHADRYIAKVVGELRKVLTDEGISPLEVMGRVKRPYSIYRKMKEQQCDFESVHDLIAFRVVVERLADCYAALGVAHSRWTPVPGRFKDYIALPKTNLYQSLHTTLIGPEHQRFEIQIRTAEMHRTADMGIAAHWSYKEKGVDLSGQDLARFRWLRQLMEFQKEVPDPEEFFDGVKVDLFSDEVYAFTPKGDVKVFPRGATPVDFAYAIHSEIGQHCEGARVNGAIAPLDYRLHNGDTVEILTSPSHEPNKDWLGFVRTARAKSLIRSHVRGEEHRASVKLGRELLESEMRKRDLSYQRLLKSGELDKTVAKLGLGSHDDVLARVGFGQLSAGQVLAPILEEGGQAEKTLKPGLFEKTVQTVTRGVRSGVVIGEEGDEALVRFAKCCNPLPGDPVTGWITRGRGVSVHRRGCKRALELEPERRIECRWSRLTKVQLPVTLRIVTADRPGILANLSRAFNDRGVNITEANCKASVNGRALNTFQFMIGDVGKLRSLQRVLAKVDGVYEVERI